MGGQISVDGQVGRNISIGGGDIRLRDTANINGSVVIGAGNVTIQSPLNSNLTVGAGNLTISAPINGDVKAGIGRLTLSSDTQIKGNLDYWSEQEADISPSASVSGTTEKHYQPSFDLSQTEVQNLSQKIYSGKRVISTWFTITNLLSNFIIALLLIHFFPNCTQTAVSIINKKPWTCLGTGFATLILTPIAFVILLTTVVGIPLAFILLFIYFLSIFLSKIYISLWLGTFLTQKTNYKLKKVWLVLIGLITYTIISHLPFVGAFIRLFGLTIGLGTIFLCTKESYQSYRKKT